MALWPGDSMPFFDNTTNMLGASSRLAAAHSAYFASWACRLAHARWAATWDDDVPVSTVRLGPLRPSTYDARRLQGLAGPKETGEETSSYSANDGEPPGL